MYTDRQLQKLFTVTNMVAVRIPKGNAGQTTRLRINGADITATYLTNLKAGEAIALLTDKGNWYLVGEASQLINQSSKRIIEYRKTQPIAKKLASFIYLFESDNKIYVGDGAKNKEIILNEIDENFNSLENLRLTPASFIHNDGKTYRLSFANIINGVAFADEANWKIINYSNNGDRYAASSGILFQAITSVDNQNHYKGSQIWYSNELRTDLVFAGDTIDAESPPFTGSGEFVVVTDTETEDITTTGNFTSNTFTYFLDNQTEQYNEGMIDYSVDEYVSSTNPNSSTANNQIINTNQVTLKGLDFNFKHNHSFNLSGGIQLGGYSLTNTTPIIFWKNGYIYAEETDSSYSVSRNVSTTALISSNVSRNIKYYFVSGDNSIELNTDPFAHLVMNNSIDINASSINIITSTSNYILNIIKADLVPAAVFVGRGVQIGKIEGGIYYLLEGAIASFSYTPLNTEGTIIRIDCTVNIINKTTKEYISFATPQGTLITLEGSIFTYLHLQSLSSNCFGKDNYFSYSVEFDAHDNSRGSLRIPYMGGLVNQRIARDNLIGNNIYISNIPNFTNGNKKAFIERWNIGNDGKIRYQDTKKVKIRGIPNEATLYSSSYHP